MLDHIIVTNINYRTFHTNTPTLLCNHLLHMTLSLTFLQSEKMSEDTKSKLQSMVFCELHGDDNGK